MEKKKLTLIIGIPANNEEANIGYLLESLLKQKKGDYRIDKIIVASDGSTDRTIKITRQLKDQRVIAIDNKMRKGKPARLNQIVELFKSDVLVLLDADICIDDDSFIGKLIDPIINQRADLTSAKMIAVRPKTWVEKVLYESLLLKNYINY